VSPFMQQSVSAWEDDGGARPPAPQRFGSDRGNRNQTSGATQEKANNKPSPTEGPNITPQVAKRVEN